jgi:glyoxylase-like metal-dependent hydrolase (beta-lactamase superfamily II)
VTDAGFTEVAPRVWVARYATWDVNVTVVEGERGLVVVDTMGSDETVQVLRDDLRRLSTREVVAVVNTHGHWDHAFGNARFRGSPIWGHVRCAAMILEHGEEQRARLLDAYPAEVAEQFREVELVPPTDLFEDAATLDLGDRQVELRYLGRGHTDNDVVALVPDAAVLFAGDLLENAPAPGFGDSYPIAWVSTGGRLLDLVDGVVAPGHGDPFERAFAERQVGELGFLAELLRDAVAGSIGLDEAVRRSPFPAAATGEAIERARIELTE